MDDESRAFFILMLAIAALIVYGWRSWRKERLMGLMEGLPEFEAEVVFAHVWKRQSVSEIAEKTELPEAYVQKRLDQGLAKLEEAKVKDAERDEA